MIEEIPNILIKFRENRFGVSSDIRKAFLQIAVCEQDRDFLKFLWVDAEENEVVYRHRRVVFGVNSSPFLLAATIQYHLEKMKEKQRFSDQPYSNYSLSRLVNGFYVDNCITSVENPETLLKFIQEATLIMLEGKFELVGWEHSQITENEFGEEKCVPILGLTWNTSRDTLSLRDCINMRAKSIIK